MKQYHKSILPLMLLLPMSMAGVAETSQQPKAPMDEMKMESGMGMGMMGDMTEEQMEQHLRSMQDHMLAMHDLSNQILAEKDAAKKEQLKNQQLQLMKAHRAQMMEHRMQKKMRHQQKMQSPATIKK
jgi:hypothetical protein